MSLRLKLRAARGADIGAGVAALDSAMAVARTAGLESHGLGLYRVLHAGERAASVVDGLKQHGLGVRVYQGGALAIAPGLEISTNALISGTAALRMVEFSAPRSVIGRGTVEAIQSGGLYGHAGLVDGIVERIADELDEPITRVATGGLASTIVPHCSSVETVDPYLTLEGLRIIFDRNQEIE